MLYKVFLELLRETIAEAFHLLISLNLLVWLNYKVAFYTFYCPASFYCLTLCYITFAFNYTHNTLGTAD